MILEDIIINLDDITFRHKNSLQIAEKIKGMAKNEEKLFELKRNNIAENLMVDMKSLGIFDELTEIELENLIRKVVDKFGIDDNYNIIKPDVIRKALQLNEKKKDNKTKSSSLRYEEKDLRNIYQLAKKKKIHAYEALKENGYIKDPIKEFLKVE